MAAYSVHQRLGLCSPGLTQGRNSVSRLRTPERPIALDPLKVLFPQLNRNSDLHTEFLGAVALPGRAQSALTSCTGVTKQRVRIEASSRASSSFRCTQQLATLPETMSFCDVSRSRIKRRCRCRAESRGTEKNGRPAPKTATNGAAEPASDGANRAKGGGVNKRTEANVNAPGSKFRSSWDAKDSTGRTYIENLGKASENVNMVVGAKEGMIDSVFIGDFLGKESDIVFKYRQKVTRQFGHIHGDYYIAPSFMDKVVTHIAKNFLADQIKARTPLILGVWGGKGQGKSFQVELIFRALGLEPVIMSAGELESEWAGTPARLIRDRYRTAGQVVKVQGKMSALVINDIDAGAGRFENTQMTVNTQMVMGTLMNLADNPTRVSVGQEFREADVVPRVPIILTGNDLSTLWAPLIRDGRMDKFYWTPTRDDLINIVTCMYRKDGLAESDIEALVDVFPKQALDFYGAMRSRTYDNQVKKWLDSVGGPEKLRNIFPVKPGKEHPQLDHYQQTLENLIKAGRELVEEQEMVTSLRLSEEYMNSPPATGPGIGLTVS